MPGMKEDLTEEKLYQKRREIFKAKEESALGIREELKARSFVRKGLNFLWTTCMLCLTTVSERNWSGLRMMNTPVLRVGMLQGSILSHDLYIPDYEDQTRLERISAVAGRWHGYDFKKREILERLGWLNPERIEKYREGGGGRMIAFPVPEVMSNEPSQLTPTRTFDICRLEDLILMQLPTISELEGMGFVCQTTYKQAYQEEGLYDRYRRDLILAGVDEGSVFQVTPKGNGLVALVYDFGVPKKSPERQMQLKPAGLSF